MKPENVLHLWWNTWQPNLGRHVSPLLPPVHYFLSPFWVFYFLQGNIWSDGTSHDCIRSFFSSIWWIFQEVLSDHCWALWSNKIFLFFSSLIVWISYHVVRRLLYPSSLACSCWSPSDHRLSLIAYYQRRSVPCLFLQFGNSMEWGVAQGTHPTVCTVPKAAKGQRVRCHQTSGNKKYSVTSPKY